MLKQDRGDSSAWRPKRYDDVSGNNADMGTGSSSRGAVLSCSEYDELVQALEAREPTAADFRALAKHEADCPSDRHSETGVERKLGLPEGALRNGSREHGLKSPREVVSDLVDRHLRER